MQSTTADATAAAAETLAAELADVLGTDQPPRGCAPCPASADWAASGAMHLTGRADEAPRLSPGAPASWMRAAASFLDTAVPDAAALLGERAACAGLTRQAPRSVGGTFRSMRAADGWFGLTLARQSDVELVPALVEGPVPDDP
jgi:hypothetical protein